ncbi:hypothetical protein UFOVP602_25 [uncultured Caudovirales phage]|jgi:hypothetical protein|uniref:Uncharacterized protein n=1 Tax=uncultured Caudovirales phage TaxID=2100421 RepID=A0A6J5N466_9CAUD|nr:hypothetical protein UFOVP602_25 [uncultured Caudovirales phage]
MITLYITLADKDGTPDRLFPVVLATFVDAEKYVQRTIRAFSRRNLSIRRDTFDDEGIIDIVERGVKK